MPQFTLTHTDRLRLSQQILPQSATSLEESVIISDLRSRLNLNEEERARISLSDSGSFDAAADEGTSTGYEFSDEEARIVALSFRRIEQEAEENRTAKEEGQQVRGATHVPADEQFVSIYKEFAGEVEKVS